MCKVFVRQNWTKFKQIENFLTRAQHLSVHGVGLESKEKKSYNDNKTIDA